MPLLIHLTCFHDIHRFNRNIFICCFIKCQIYLTEGTFADVLEELIIVKLGCWFFLLGSIFLYVGIGCISFWWGNRIFEIAIVRCDARWIECSTKCCCWLVVESSKSSIHVCLPVIILSLRFWFHYDYLWTNIFK